MSQTTEYEFEGPVVWRGDPAYEDLRQGMLWNALTPGRHPEAIVRATSDHDVVAAVRLARSRGLQVAVRAGGHSWVGSPLRDDTVLIDLSARRAVHVDADAGTATFEPAITGAEVADLLAPHGLAFPVGHCGSVGVGGYLLSGGLGWNGALWGPACASVLAVDVVTPDGELVRADDEQNVDLFWAARGAGPGFPGVVTRFHVALQPLPRAITTTTALYDADAFEDLAPWASEVAAALPYSVEMTVMLTEAGADLPDDPARKVAVVTATAFADDDADAVAQLAPLTTSPVAPLADRAPEPSPFPVLFREFGGRWREGCRFASDNVWTDGDFTDNLLPLRDALRDAPSPSSFAFAGMSQDPPPDAPEEELPDMAFSLYARSFVACYAMWDEPADDEANLAWLPSAMAAIEAPAAGHYVAEADLLATDDHARRSYTDDGWDRLRRIREAVDPDGLFVDYLGPQDAAPGEVGP